jgi:hypothetical protein
VEYRLGPLGSICVSTQAHLEDLQLQLDAAVWDGDLAAVCALLGAFPDASLANGDHGERWHDTAYGCTTGAPFKRPLARAAQRGHLAIVRELLAAGASIDAVNYRSETALHLAVAGGHRDCIDALLDAGADPNLVACEGSVLAHARTKPELIAYLLDRGADPRPVDAFERDAADLIATDEFVPLRDRVAGLRQVVERWPEGDPALARHAEQLLALEAELASKKKRKRRGKDKLAKLLTPEALAAEDWAAKVRAHLPTCIYGADEGADKARASADRLRARVLASPEAVGHPHWGELLRALVELSPDYREITEDAYGEAFEPDQADEDEGGVIEMFSDDALSTIPDALILLATPAALARADWPELVRATVDAHTQRYGTSPVLSFGRDEAEALFASAQVRAHPEAGVLWDLVDAAFDLEVARP